MKRCLTLCCWLCLGLLPLQAWPAARVVDLVGVAERAVAARATSTLRLFDLLQGKEQLSLRADASLTLLFEPGGEQWQLRGPGRWELQEQGVKTLQGAPAVALGSVAPALRPTELKGLRVAAGAVAMRASGAPSLLPWPDATRLLAPPTALQWADAGAGSRYKLTLATADGQAVHSSQSSETRLELATLPAAESPKPGMSYAWSVEVVAGARAGTRAFAAFTVADADTARQWQGLRPAADAPVSTWVLYAAAAEAAGYIDEARQAWERVRQQRPQLRLPDAAPR